MEINNVIVLYLILCLAFGKPSFSSNVVEEKRPGCRNLQRPLIMVNLSEKLLGEKQVIRAKVQFGV